MNLITTNDALIEACAALKPKNLSRLIPNLCAKAHIGRNYANSSRRPNAEFALDPLADGIEIEPLLDLMRDENILKVFHAPRQDLEILYRLMNNKLPAPIFDSQIAAMAIGLGEQTAYDTLVMAMLGHHVDKSSRFTDWSRRPLSESQIRYAIHDVTYLRDLFPKLIEKLESLGRREWVEEEMKGHSVLESYDTTPTNAWKRMKPKRFNPEYLAAFFAVTTWREWFAQERDIPRSRALKDDAIYEIAEQRPRSAEAMDKLRAVPKGFAKSKGGEALLEALLEALEAPEEFAPKISRPKPNPNGIGAIMELLKVLLRSVSEELDVAPRLIASVADLEAIAISDDADCEVLRGWRREVFGEKALRLKRGELALSIVNRKVVTSEVVTTES